MDRQGELRVCRRPGAGGGVSAGPSGCRFLDTKNSHGQWRGLRFRLGATTRGRNRHRRVVTDDGSQPTHPSPNCEGGITVRYPPSPRAKGSSGSALGKPNCQRTTPRRSGRVDLPSEVTARRTGRSQGSVGRHADWRGCEDCRKRIEDEGQAGQGSHAVTWPEFATSLLLLALGTVVGIGERGEPLLDLARISHVTVVVGVWD
jgi:hypothetical protein